MNALICLFLMQLQEKPNPTEKIPTRVLLKTDDSEVSQALSGKWNSCKSL